MQKEKPSRKTLTQNVNIRMDARTDGRMDRKTKTIYPSTYLVCQGYKNLITMMMMISLTSGVKITYSFVKCGHSIYFFLNSANLICRGTDISKYFRETLGLLDNKSQGSGKPEK